MTPPPTGRILATPAGHDLVLERTFRADVEDVWASITESERTARWFASWTGEAGVGRTLRYRMEHEEGRPEAELTIEACDPPHHLAVRTVDEHGGWHLEARLVQEGDTTTLTFTHHLEPSDRAEHLGPGWEYYLDLLVASREGRALPPWEDYFPAQQDHYRDLAPG